MNEAMVKKLLCVCLVSAVTLAHAASSVVNGITWSYLPPSSQGVTIGTYLGPEGFGAIPNTTQGDITIPSKLVNRSVIAIGEYAFTGCSKLTNVTIPPTVTSIGFSAFDNCSSLTNMTIPASVTTIEADAFFDCSGLKTVTIPASVTLIGDNAFYGCARLERIVVDEANTKYKSLNGMLLTKDGTTLINGVNGVVTIPASVTNILIGAFRACNALERFVVDEANPKYKSINGMLFTKNGKELIVGVNGDVTIPDGVTSIRNYAFYNCNGLTSVTIPDSVTDIGWDVFERCSRLESVTIPEGVTYLAGYLFTGCSKLKTVTIPASVTSIHNETFYHCGGLEQIVVDEANPNYKSVNGMLLSKDGTTLLVGVNGGVTIPDGVTSFSSWAFADCVGLTSVTIPSSVTTISWGTFYGCSGLQSVAIPEGVTVLNGRQFTGCSGLKSMKFPSSLTSIYDTAVEGCGTLESVDFAGPPPSGLNNVRIRQDAVIRYNVDYADEWQDVIKARGWTNATATEFKKPDGGPYSQSVDGITWTYTVSGGKVSVGGGSSQSPAVPTATQGDVSVPLTLGKLYVTNIAEHAFHGCSALTNITIHGGVTSIGEGAFDDCDALASVAFEGAPPAGLQNANLKTGTAIRYNANYEAEWLPVIEACGWTNATAYQSDPSVLDDPWAVVTSDLETGFTVKPSAENRNVVVLIPSWVQPDRVTVEVGVDVATVKPNGAAVRIVKGANDLTDYLTIPAADASGVIDIAKATVKEAVAKEVLDPTKGAVIALTADAPSLTTSATKPGLVYTLYEGATPKGLEAGDSKVGDGQPWTPNITVKGGTSGFYTIGVTK